jgi:hypothetical protein
MYDLAQRVLRYEDVLVDASDICGEIDRSVLVERHAMFANTKSTVFLPSRRQLAFTS